MPDTPIPPPTAALAPRDVEAVMRGMANGRRPLSEIIDYANAWMAARNERLLEEARAAELARIRARHAEVQRRRPRDLAPDGPTLFAEAS